MKKAICIGFLVVTVVGIIIGSYLWFWWSPYGVMVKGETFEGLIRDRIPRKETEQWEVLPNDIRRMEPRLAAFVSDNQHLLNSTVPIDPRDYRRHYSGIEKDGRRFIYVEMYRMGFISRRDWRRGVIVGGGAAHDNWCVRYYPDTQTFTNLYPFPLGETD